MLVAQHRRAKMVGKATATVQAADARVTPTNGGVASKAMLNGDSLEDRFAKLDRDEKVDKLLGELKQKQARMLEAG